MVFTNKYTEILIQKFPGFAKSNALKEAIELFGDKDSVDVYTVFCGLTNYVTDDLIKNNKNVTKEEINLYQYIEEIRLNYSSFSKPSLEYDIDNAVCTCFLENLINRASANRISYFRFVPYLGEKSKEYCSAWDKFTGVKSPGL